MVGRLNSADRLFVGDAFGLDQRLVQLKDRLTEVLETFTNWVLDHGIKSPLFCVGQPASVLLMRMDYLGVTHGWQ